MKAGGSRCYGRKRPLHYFQQSLFIDVTHSECRDTRFANDAPLAPVDIAQADEHDIPAIDFRGVSENFGQLFRSSSDATGERHSVNVAAGTGFGRVHIGVSV